MMKKAYAKKLEAADVHVELNVTKGTIHAFNLNKESTITRAAIESKCFKKDISKLVRIKKDSYKTE